MDEAAAVIGDVLVSPPPDVTAEAAAALAREHFAVRGEVRALSGERDANFLVRAADGAGYVLKVANVAEPAEVTAFQTGLLVHLARRDPGLPVPRVVPARTGDPSASVDLGGRPHVVRMLTFLEGTPLHLVAAVGEDRRRAVARCLARLARALEDYDHPAAGHDLVWDVVHAARLGPLLPSIGDAQLRRLAEDAVEAFAQTVVPRLPRLPRQVVHNDFNPHNLLVDPARPAEVAGVIDFGDAVRTARAADVAVAASYHLAGVRDAVGAVADFAAAYHAVRPLTEEEARVLVPLVRARLATTLAVTAWRAARRPEDAAYILRNAPAAAEALRALADVGAGEAADRVAAACDGEAAA